MQENSAFVFMAGEIVNETWCAEDGIYENKRE